MASIFDMFMGAAAGGSGVFSIFAQMDAAKQEQEQLKKQEQEVEMASAQQSLQRAQRVREVMSQATATESSRGVSVASPSFQAVQRSSYEKFNEDKDAAALNLSFKKDAIEAQKKNVRDKEISGIFGSITSTATSLAMFI